MDDALRIDVLGGRALSDLAPVVEKLNEAIDEDGNVVAGVDLTLGETLLLAEAVRSLEALVGVERHEDLEREASEEGPPPDLVETWTAVRRAERVGEDVCVSWAIGRRSP